MSIGNNKSLTKDSDIAFYTQYQRLAEVLAGNRKFVKLIENGYRVKNVKFLCSLELDNSILRIIKRYALVTIAKDNELKGIFLDIVNGKTLEIFDIKN